ncbi:adhesion G protein-coupled receptor E4-like [Latimeria chalumnae]|uniref:adhesion G protein-coupled receptor E4-like n=1 Tax=Latimeria chalumnae TaxID=7897 RepID=UPI00313D934E
MHDPLTQRQKCYLLSHQHPQGTGINQTSYWYQPNRQRYHNKLLSDEIACAIIAGILHYSFLACFAWMCLAAVQLCLMVINLKAVKFFRSHVIRRRYMYPVGYGAPAVIVAISAGVDHQGYGTAKHCWLSMERYFLWSFLGPVCLIILVNLTLFIVIIWILKEKLASLDKDVSTVKESRSLTFKVMAQFLILGCTWMFGLFHVGQGTLIMAYVFTILNSFQGLFIFLVYCVLNRQFVNLNTINELDAKSLFMLLIRNVANAAFS